MTEPVHHLCFLHPIESCDQSSPAGIKVVKEVVDDSRF